MIKKSASQLFFDSLQSKDHSVALDCLEKFGAQKTGALTWLAIRGVVEPYWIEALEKSPIPTPPSCFDESLLILLSSKKSWDYQRDYFDFLLENSSSNLFNLYPLHHASFHGASHAFDALEEKYEKVKNKNFNWNSITSDNHTPLYLALSELHSETVISILRRGGLSNFLIKEKNGTVSVLQKVYREKSQNLSIVKNFWSSANEKAKLIDEISSSAPPRVSLSNHNKSKRKI